jgi:arabinosaccharide transport system substrate-binding protein
VNFPFGRAPLAILIVSLLSGLCVFVLGSGDAFDGRKPDLVLATFVKEQADAYNAVLPKFEKANGVKIQVELVDQKALQDRLQSAMQIGAEVPDMVELMYNTLGIFTRGPINDVGFLDLTDRVKTSGLYDRVVSSRFSKWSAMGHIFALPHDVHPVMLAYRRDLVEQMGIDVSKLTTWDEFARVGRQVVASSRGPDGTPAHFMMDLPSDGNDILILLMEQNGGNLFNARGQVAFDSPQTLQVVLWYVKATNGKTRIGYPCGQGQSFDRALLDGLILFVSCPDWRSNVLQNEVPSLKGKLALMPLPAWNPGDRRTSSWGGSGLAIARQCKNPDLAWKLAMYLYYDPDQLGQRFLATHIIPPLKEAWSRPEYSIPSAFYSGQPLGQVYAQLAPDVPEQHDSEYVAQAEAKLSQAFTSIAEYYDAHGEDGLEQFARDELKRRADRVRLEMSRNKFLNAPDQAGEVAQR